MLSCVCSLTLQIVSLVSGYANNLSKGHWQVMKWILQYIMQTLNVSLVFQQDDDIG